jgi:hypothetical protein
LGINSANLTLSLLRANGHFVGSSSGIETYSVILLSAAKAVVSPALGVVLFVFYGLSLFGLARLIPFLAGMRAELARRKVLH